MLHHGPQPGAKELHSSQPGNVQCPPSQHEVPASLGTSLKSTSSLNCLHFGAASNLLNLHRAHCLSSSIRRAPSVPIWSHRPPPSKAGGADLPSQPGATALPQFWGRRALSFSAWGRRAVFVKSWSRRPLSIPDWSRRARYLLPCQPGAAELSSFQPGSDDSFGLILELLSSLHFSLKPSSSRLSLEPPRSFHYSLDPINSLSPPVSWRAHSIPAWSRRVPSIPVWRHFSLKTFAQTFFFEMTNACAGLTYTSMHEHLLFFRANGKKM